MLFFYAWFNEGLGKSILRHWSHQRTEGPRDQRRWARNVFQNHSELPVLLLDTILRLWPSKHGCPGTQKNKSPPCEKLCASTSQHQLFGCSHSTGISVQPFRPQMQEPTKCWLNMIDLQKNGLSDPLEHLFGAICISNYQIHQTSCHIFGGSIKIYCE